MRLNFSGSDEDEIREGIRRIGAVVGEQVELYETITSEHRLPEPADTGEPADVVPLRPPRREA